MTREKLFGETSAKETWLALGKKGLVPAWFLSIGVAGMWVPLPAVPVSVLVLVVMLFAVVIPALAVAFDIWKHPSAEARVSLPLRYASARRSSRPA